MSSPAILVMAFNRPDFLRQTLDKLFALPEVHKYLVYVSQDGDHSGVAAIAKEYDVTHFQHPRQGNLDGPQCIARHYKYV